MRTSCPTAPTRVSGAPSAGRWAAAGAGIGGSSSPTGMPNRPSAQPAVGDLRLPLGAPVDDLLVGAGRRCSTTSRSPRRTAGRRGAAAAPARRTTSSVERRATRAGRRRGRAAWSRRRRPTATPASTRTPCSKVGSTSRCSVGAGRRAGARRRAAACTSRPARCRRAASRGRPAPRSPAPVTGAGAWWAKLGVDVPVGVRQRHPQLGAVQRRGRRRRDLGVADAAAGGHQVDLAGPHHRVVAGAVAVLDLAGEEPAHGLQPGVRVRRRRSCRRCRRPRRGRSGRRSTRRRSASARRCGSVRRTRIARGPPSGTSRGVMISTPAAGAGAAVELGGLVLEVAHEPCARSARRCSGSSSPACRRPRARVARLGDTLRRRPAARAGR